jgi:hypothetical protein
MAPTLPEFRNVEHVNRHCFPLGKQRLAHLPAIGPPIVGGRRDDRPNR